MFYRFFLVQLVMLNFSICMEPEEKITSDTRVRLLKIVKDDQVASVLTITYEESPKKEFPKVIHLPEKKTISDRIFALEQLLQRSKAGN